MDNKLISIIVAALVLGGGVVAYQKTNGFKELTKKESAKVHEHNEHEVNVENNKEEHVNENSNGEHNEEHEGALFDFNNVKSPEDLAKEARNVGPYTCYITVTDKQTHKKQYITVSSDGKVSYIYVKDTGANSVGKIWLTKEGMYLESREANGNVRKLKFTGKAGDMYKDMLSGTWFHYLNQAKMAEQDTETDHTEVKCYKGKVDIAKLNESEFKDFTIDFKKMNMNIHN